MLKVHLSNGETLGFDLDSAEDARRWLQHAGDPIFQARITGLTLQHNGFACSLPRPAGFSLISMFAENVAPNGHDKGGESIECTVDDVRIIVKAHNGHKAARVNVKRLHQLR